MRTASGCSVPTLVHGLLLSAMDSVFHLRSWYGADIYVNGESMMDSVTLSQLLGAAHSPHFHDCQLVSHDIVLMVWSYEPYLQLRQGT